jgi:hypothetical protein
MTHPRRRSSLTPGAFAMAGVPVDTLYGRRAAVTWHRGILSGDPVMVTAVHDYAAALGACLGDPAIALVVLTALFVPGTIDRG